MFDWNGGSVQRRFPGHRSDLSPAAADGGRSCVVVDLCPVVAAEACALVPGYIFDRPAAVDPGAGVW